MTKLKILNKINIQFTTLLTKNLNYFQNKNYFEYFSLDYLISLQPMDPKPKTWMVISKIFFTK